MKRDYRLSAERNFKIPEFPYNENNIKTGKIVNSLFYLSRLKLVNHFKQIMKASLLRKKLSQKILIKGIALFLILLLGL